VSCGGQQDGQGWCTCPVNGKLFSLEKKRLRWDLTASPSAYREIIKGPEPGSPQ